MSLCVVFEKGDQNKFLRHVKSKTGLSWDKLANKINKNRSTIFFYLKEEGKMSHKTFLRLLKISDLGEEKFYYKLVEVTNSLKKISKPKINKKLAEFLGILAGDGHLSENPYEVCVVCHRYMDKDFIERHVKILSEGLFGIDMAYYRIRNITKARLYSKELVLYLNKEFGCPIGNKMSHLNIPKEIFRNNKFLMPYIRGLFDTDGNFYGRRNNEPVVEIISGDLRFREQIRQALEKIGFNPTGNYKNVTIYRKDQIDRFFKLIKPANKKHLWKYEKFKNMGIIPKTGYKRR